MYSPYAGNPPIDQGRPDCGMNPVYGLNRHWQNRCLSLMYCMDVWRRLDSPTESHESHR